MKWTSSEDALLISLYRKETTSEIGRRLGRTERAVINRHYRLGLGSTINVWSDDEVQRLQDVYGSHRGMATLDLTTLGKELKRDPKNICRKARLLGLTEKHRRLGDNQKDGIGERAKQRIAANGHPRGYQGKTHTAEARLVMSEASKRYFTEASAESLKSRTAKMVKTRIERFGTAGPTFLLSQNAYSRAKGGRRRDLGNQYFRSGWEANFARWLNIQVEQGMLREWSYEPETFVFHGVERGPFTYTPDFRAVKNDLSIVFYEVKGWMDGKSKSRLRRMTEFYPQIVLEIIDASAYKEIYRQGQYIPGWEK